MAELHQLRELHDTYVWEVNAAVGEDRLDLVWQLADDYMDRALQLLASGESPTCGSPDCAVCTRPRDVRPASRANPFRRWLRH
jgi:hypothetical protein